MAIINTPGAGVSPYQTTDTSPTVLRAGANGATVLANVATAAAANASANTTSTAADTGSNTSVYVTGQTALNSLITSNQPGTFQGANVNITLEEQNFNTTNQVTSTINYAEGSAGSIQYNNGANGFAGSDYFTYTSGNVVTPGIRTDGYFYSNGAPFTGGGNAAIGNFVFNGDNMTIAHANSTLSVTGNGTGNVNISANSKTWTFAADGNLTTPGNIQMGNTRGIYSSSAGYVVGLRMSNTEPSVKLVANDHEWQFNSNGILKLPVPFSSVYPSLTMTNSSNLLISGYQGAGFGEDGGNITVGGGTSDSGNIGNATVFGQQVTVQTQLDGGSSVYNWIFGSDGNTTFPNNAIQSPANVELSVRSSTTSDDDNQVRLNQTSLDLYAYNSNTGSYSELYLDNSSASTPYAYISVEATASPERRWIYSADGNLRLPAGTPSINYANGSPYSQENKIFNGNTYANIDFPSGNLAVGVNVTPVTGAWINTYGNIVVNDQYNSEGESVLIDGGGNVYVTGASYNPAFSADQAFIRKLSPSGQVMWQYALPQSVNGSLFTSGETLAQDGSGNIYWLTNLWLDNSGNVQPMVAKLNSSNGYPSWTTQIGNVYYGEDITVNSSGQVFVVTNNGGRITSLNANGTVAWSRDPSNGGVSIVDTGTYVIVGYSAGTVGAYNYSGNLLWTNQVFNTGPEVWGLAWDGTNWYAADSNGYIMKISGADNSTILWQKHINRNGTGGNIFNTWIEYADGYIYAGGTGNDGQVSDAFITVKIDASNGNLVWARSLEAQTAGQWYWYGHHDISVGGGYYAITGYAQPAGLNNDKQVLAQLPTDGSLAGSTVGPYRYVDVPALTVDTVSVAGSGYNGSPSQPATVSVTHNYTFTGLVAPSPEVNILEPFVTGPVWTFNNNGDLQLPSGGKLGYAGMGWTGLKSANGTPIEIDSYYANGNISGQIYMTPNGNLSLVGFVEGGASNAWSFNSDASVLFPYQPTNQRTGLGEALVFTKSNNQKVIATAPGDAGQPTVSRLVIAGGDGYQSGEGGDIYLWAGKSGVGVAGGSGGGDIKVDAGDALNSAQGGTVKIRGGSSYDNGIGGGLGGFVEIDAGGGNVGGPVTISSGQGNSQANSGNVSIQTPYGGTWYFDNYGNLTTPGSSGNITGANVIIANIISALGDVESANIKGATLSAIGNVIANNAVITNYITCAAMEAVGNVVGNTIYAGNSSLSKGQVSLANVIFVGADAAAEYVQSAMINTGGNGSADWVSYANNGNTDQGWVDMGMTGNTFNDPNYQVTDPNDGYVLVQGTNTGTPLGGNLVLATGNVGLAHDIVFATGGFTHANIKARIVDATGEFSVVGNITGSYIFGNGSGLTGVGAASVPSQNILPTIQSIAIANTSNVSTVSSGQGWANVTVSNVIPITEYGVIITSGTSSQKYATGALGNIPGTEKITFTTAQTGQQFTVYAYVTSNAGTYYSTSATGTSGICLLAGTQIALSDGSHKAIEHITYTDKLLSWDFDRGCYAETTALWIKRSETGSQYNLLTFSDGTTLRTFDQHRIFNKQAGAFTYPMTDATPVGTVTVNEHGQEIVLINKQVIQDTIEYYNVITDYHMNLFSDSVLTSCRFNNIYPVVDMKFAKDSRTPRTRTEFANIPDRFFHGLRLAEQTADVDAAEWYVNRLVATEVLTQSELAF